MIDFPRKENQLHKTKSATALKYCDCVDVKTLGIHKECNIKKYTQKNTCILFISPRCTKSKTRAKATFFFTEVLPLFKNKTKPNNSVVHCYTFK